MPPFDMRRMKKEAGEAQVSGAQAHSEVLAGLEAKDQTRLLASRSSLSSDEAFDEAFYPDLDKVKLCVSYQ